MEICKISSSIGRSFPYLLKKDLGFYLYRYMAYIKIIVKKLMLITRHSTLEYASTLENLINWLNNRPETMM